MRARLKSAQVDDSLIGRTFDDVIIALEEFDTQQSVVMGRLVLGRNAQPLVIGVKRISHHTPARQNRPVEQALILADPERRLKPLDHCVSCLLRTSSLGR
jgi:hypothetical protein